MCAAEVETGVFNIERGVPWHGLGVENQGFMVASELLQLAELDWEVEKVPLYLADGTVLPDNFAIVRHTDGNPLGVVGNRYEPAQNEEVLSFMDNIIGSGQAAYDSAWSLRGGKTVAVTAELGERGSLPEGEEIKTFLTAMNNHDGSGKIRIVVSPIRVVCMNTLAMAVKNAKYTWARKHTQNWSNEDNIAEARATLELAAEYQDYITRTADELLGQAFSRGAFKEFAKVLTIGKVPTGEKPSPQSVTKYENLVALYGNSENLGNIRTTKWGAWNAVVEWVDYDGNYRGDDVEDKRTESIMMGRGVDVKTQAFQMLTAA